MARLNQDQDTLHKIAQGALSLVQTIGPSTYASGPQPKLAPHHYLTIRLPQPITSLCISRGLDPSAAEKLNQVYLDTALSLKDLHETQHRRAIEKCLDSGAFHIHDMDKFVSLSQHTLLSRYKQQLNDWQSKLHQFSQRHVRSSARDSMNAMERRPTFKNESVPVLEKAFVTNPYPSRADKELLAEETGMEYKQVNIWFQNRRARSKKEGTAIQRTATFVTPLQTPKQSVAQPDLDTQSADVRIQEMLNNSSEMYGSCNIPNRSPDLLALNTRPAHAFPTPYPPFYDEDPFPVRDGCAGLFSIPWLRKRTTEIIPKSPVDIDELTAQMNSLSLSSDALVGYKSHIPSFTFVVPRAPLPALIRTATASSRAQPATTLVSAAGTYSARKLYRTLPVRLPRVSVERRASPLPSSLDASSWSTPIPFTRASTSGRPRRSETRSPSPPHSSRSSSLSSVASSRSYSSSWSVASSIGPITPSTSPCIGVLSLAKDNVSPSTSAHAHRSSSISDNIHVFSSFR